MKKNQLTQRVVIFALFFLLSANIALAVEYGGIGGRPAYPRADNPRTDSIFVHDISPGQTVNEGVKVINNTAERKTIYIYGTDSVTSSDGAFACAQQGEPKNNVGAWINISKNEVTLEPDTNEVVNFTITAPQNTGVGEHNGCIVMQEKKETSGQQSGVVLSFRTGLRVALTVPGEIVKKLEIAGFIIKSSAKGGYTLQPSVKNTGNVSIDTDVSVSTAYFFGKKLVDLGGQYPVLRGETSTWNFELAKPFWGGWYKATLNVDYNSDPKTGLGEKGSQATVSLAGPALWFWSMPSSAALAIELLVLAVLLGLIWFGIHRCLVRRKIRTTWTLYTVQAGDELVSLAQKYGISWRLLARANKLSAPFALKTGQSIKVPPIK